MNLRLVVLGSAQDGGVPQLGMSPAQEQRYTASLAIVSDGGHAFLIDASPDLRHQQRALMAHDWYSQRSSADPFDGVAITHAHMGHYTGLVNFGMEAQAARGLPCWVTPRMAQFLTANQPWQALVVFGHIALNPLAEGQEFEPWEGVSLRPVVVPHRAEFTDTVGFSITNQSTGVSAFYLPDLDAWSPEAEREVANHDISLVDTSFYSRDELPNRDMSTFPHPIATDTMDRFEHLVGERMIVLTHLNHSNPLTDPQSVESKSAAARGFHVATDMMEIDL
ncbi:MAG: MBL fold metallo-hydrolase [Acidimicrobiia bacterium]|nr:MBL fold metallo-hydrolase [Acidimicrobiia bacterium]